MIVHLNKIFCLFLLSKHFKLNNKYLCNFFVCVGHESGCGITDEIAQWMDNIQNSASTEDEIPKKHHHKKLPLSSTSRTPLNIIASQNRRNAQQKTNPFNNLNKNSIFNDDFKFPYEKYTREANWKDNTDNRSKTNTTTSSSKSSTGKLDEEWHAKSHERVRRAAIRPKEENKNTCSLYIQTDPLIWRHIREGIADVSKIYLYFYFRLQRKSF